MYQPRTTDVTIEGLKVSRNNMRLILWNEPEFAHKWLCHPNNNCEDGCNMKAIKNRLDLYESEIEA